MPKIVVQTIVSDAMNAPAAAKTGWQRAASHSNTGNSSAPGSTVCHGCSGSETMIPVIAANTASAPVPSTISLRGGGLRTAAASPITNGATATMPTPSDANQCRQMVSIGTVGLWNNL